MAVVVAVVMAVMVAMGIVSQVVVTTRGRKKGGRTTK